MKKNTKPEIKIQLEHLAAEIAAGCWGTQIALREDLPSQGERGWGVPATYTRGPKSMTYARSVGSTQGSRPAIPSEALKYSVRSITKRCCGREDAAPGQRSLTSTVPAEVPLLFHSSQPWIGSTAVKNKVRPSALSSDGDEEFMPGLISLTNVVLA